MPSGPKKRRATRRKRLEEAQAKQTDELATVSIVKLSIPIEELAKGAIMHEAASVDKELEQSNQSIEEVADETKVATVDGNVIEENEFPLLNILSNEDNVVSQSADCITERKQSAESLKENESLGVESDDTKETEITPLLVPGVCVSNDIKETELLTGEPEDTVEKDEDSLSYSMSSEEMLEMYHDLLSETDTTMLDYEKIRGFFFPEAELPVVLAQPTSNKDVKEIAPNSAENTVGSSAEITSDSKVTQVVSTIAVSPATENQAGVASPVRCNPEWTAIKESIENLMARVGEFESSMHTFKEDLQKARAKLDANSV